LLLGLPDRLGPAALAGAHAAGLVAAFIVALVLAARITTARPLLRDLAGIVGATAVMAVAVWPLRAVGPAWASLLVGAAAGAGVYGTLILALDVAGLRGLVMARLRTRKAA
jgi:hypothetical protein